MNKPYYIGLDLGSSSIGWAVIDSEYKLISKSGKKLWGVRLFDSAKTAAERRQFRRQRRTINKRHWRLYLLKQELKDFVLKEDPNFYQRIKDSQLKLEDKKYSKYTLFDNSYTDIQYHREFPTIYHLREALKSEVKVRKYLNEGRYYRLLFLALNDILKNRGHFLLNDINTNINVNSSNIKEDLKAFITNLNDRFEEALIDVSEFNEVYKEYEAKNFNTRKNNLSTILLKAVLGYKFNLYAFTQNETKEKLELSFEDTSWEDKLPNNDDLVNIAKSLYDIYSKIKLNEIIGVSKSISEAKINIYEKHKADLAKLKADLKEIDSLLSTDYYNQFFRINNEKEKEPYSYTNYVGKLLDEKSKLRVPKKTKYDSFIKKLNSIKEEVHKKGYTTLLSNIGEKGYLEIPSGSMNRVIPYQLHFDELKQILEVFIKITPSNKAKEIADRIQKIMKFKVDYYVGTLSGMNSDNHWIVRNPGYEDVKITPFNYDIVINKQRTNEEFIKRMLRKCTYLVNEDCVQQETILYQTYIFYNIINKLKINDQYLTSDQKKKLYDVMISGKKSSLSQKTIRLVLGLSNTDHISGFSKDTEKPIEMSLSSLNRFIEIFPGYFDNPFYVDFFDAVINSISLIDETEKELRMNRIKELISTQNVVKVTDEQLEKLAKLTSKKWGNLSRKFLQELKFATKDGEVGSMIDLLKNTNYNLMEILYGDEERNFKQIDQENGEADNFDSNHLNEYLKHKYVAPQARRTIIQANHIIDEIVHIMGYKPSAISIEFTRESKDKKEESKSRYTKLKELYKNIKDESFILAKERLLKYENQNDELKAKKIYLYFLQAGKDLYTGKPIDFDRLMLTDSGYDIDHIYPQSKIKDDSFDNLVLTEKVINGEKGNHYPLPEEVRKERALLWKTLQSHKFISDSKYHRLTRATPLTEEELNDFVSRQKTTLDWMNKEFAEILMRKFNESRESGFIIYSKSRHAAAIRQKFDLIKVRELNNLHHAHDAYLNIVSGLIIKHNLNTKYFKDTLNWEKILEVKIKPNIEYIKKIFNYNDVFVTKKHEIKVTGPYWNQQMVKAGKALQGSKHNLDSSKYGGYTTLSTAFFTILKDNKGKKRIATISTIDCANHIINGKVDYNQLIHDKFPEYEVLYPLVPINQLVEINGTKMRLAGKSDERLNYHNTTELVIPHNYLKLVKKISIFKNKDLKSDDDKSRQIQTLNLNENELNELFEYIQIKVINSGIENQLYHRLKYEKLMNSKYDYNDLFNNLPIIQKVNTIYNLVAKFLRANSSSESKIFDFLPTIKDYRISSNITYTLKLINESYTGFYTKVIEVHNVSDGSN